MKVVMAVIGLAVPGRPIGPWSRRTGAPEASATGRDRKTLPRRVRGLPTTQVVTELRPHPPVKAGANGATPYLVDLASRATSVPFTTVTTGHERTATDNSTAASTCALHQLPR